MRRWIAISVLVIAGVVLIAVAWRDGSSPAGAPFASALPRDTVFYLGVTDVPATATRIRALDLAAQPAWRPFAEATHIDPWIAEFLKNESKLGRQAALIGCQKTGGLDWIVLVAAGPETAIASATGTHDSWHYVIEGDHLALSRDADALRRFREAPRARIDIVPGEGVLAYVVPSAFPSDTWSAWCARWRDFDSVSARLEIGSDVRIHALARYSGASYRPVLEHVIHAPCRAVPVPDVAAWTAQVDHFPRVWNNFYASLGEEDRKLVDSEIQKLSHDVDDPVRTLVPRLGPMWSVALSRSGRLAAAIEAHRPDDLLATAKQAIGDYQRKRKADLNPDEPRIGSWHGRLGADDERITLGDAPVLWAAQAPWHCGTIIDLDALRQIVASPDAPVTELILGDTQTSRAWLDRLRWIRRAEAWTRYTGDGARVEVTVTFEGR